MICIFVNTQYHAYLRCSAEVWERPTSNPSILQKKASLTCFFWKVSNSTRRQPLPMSSAVAYAEIPDRNVLGLRIYV